MYQVHTFLLKYALVCVEYIQLHTWCEMYVFWYRYMIFGTAFFSFLKGTFVHILVIPVYILRVPDDFAGLLGPAGCLQVIHAPEQAFNQT